MDAVEVLLCPYHSVLWVLDPGLVPRQRLSERVRPLQVSVVLSDLRESVAIFAILLHELIFRSRTYRNTGATTLIERQMW